MPSFLGPGDRSVFGDKWIKSATRNKGGLHRSLGIPVGQKIPSARIEEATHSSNRKERKQAIEAETLKRLRPK